MELEENKISLTSIKQYLRQLMRDRDEFPLLEFRTIKGWLVYSLSLVMVVCVPAGAFIFVAGLLSGNILWSLLLSVSLIPLLFMLPLILVLTYIYNYRLPKKLRKSIRQGLERYEWEREVKQIGQVCYESRKNGYTYLTEVLPHKIKGRNRWFIFMICYYYVPKFVEDKEKYLEDVNSYLRGRAFFVVEEDIAYFLVPIKVFLKVDFTKSFEELHYALKRFQLRPGTYYDPIAICEKVKNTPEILAMTVFDVEIDQRWMNWAKALIDGGYVTDDMIAFSNQVPLPSNQNELKEKMDELILQFNLNVEKKYMLMNYIHTLLYENRLGQRTVLNVIESLSNLYRSSKLSSLLEFDLLYRAKCELDETGKQSSWTKDILTPENVDAYILKHLKTLVETNVSL